MRANQNYRNNKSHTPSTYVYGQATPPTVNMRYGRYDMGYNGCELIAMHNAAILLGHPLVLCDIVRDFESGFNTVLGAIFGTDPHAVGRYMKKKGFEIKKTRRIKTLESWAHDGTVLILSYWTKRLGICPLHTVAVKCTHSGVQVYNYSNKCTQVVTFDNIRSLLCTKLFICAYRVRA